ncbi:CGG triplet repeat-binding protein 1 [Plakobranchus ocellatus]|uniref:CGG triplet repeat-binding protein 1 n=1 Tax=Plakobranchus ocellatus TaxID=259542 RepID=A0AAV4A2B1_9GAST|nr:CGG triplet repeat-binding protein 1 [Plakobranchus ocellatus]
MCATANIPLSKIDHLAVQEFLRKRVLNGGFIPHFKQLQECYLERDYNKRLEDMLKGKPVAIITDEMSDDNCRFVLNELAAPLEPSVDETIKAHLQNTAFLEANNHTTVTQTVLQNAMIFHANARKSRFPQHITTKTKKKTIMPPNPISTRWNCWYHAIAYHIDHFPHYTEFVLNEVKFSKSSALDSVKKLKELLGDDMNSALLFQKMKFIKEKSKLFIEALDIFQSQQP